MASFTLFHLDKKVAIWITAAWFFTVAVILALTYPSVWVVVRTYESVGAVLPLAVRAGYDFTNFVVKYWVFAVPGFIVVWGLISLGLGIMTASQTSRISKWLLILFTGVATFGLWIAWWVLVLYWPLLQLVKVTSKV